MKTILTITIIALLIAGCGPSEKSIQAAIAKTQTAAPSITPTLTITPIPTQTANPLPPLRDCLLRQGDFLNLENYYPSSPMILKTDYIPDSIDQISGQYVSTVGNQANILFIVVLFSTVLDAKNAYFNYSANALEDGHELDIPSYIDMPLPMTMIASNDGGVKVAFEGDDTFVSIFMEDQPTIDPEDMVTFIAMLAVNQMNRLQDCGYIKNY